MEQNEDFVRLEQFVEKLIDSHNHLKNENSEINLQLQEKQQEVAELRAMIKNLQEDRSVMHNRVSGLIERIDEWEKVLDQENPGQNRNSGNNESQTISKKSSSLFKVAAEQSSEPAIR